MRLPFALNLNAVLMVLTGVVLLILAVFLAMQNAYRWLGAGLFMVGIGNLIFGGTDGFSDTSPRGQVYFKVALGAYLIGIPIVGYRLLMMILSG